MSQAKIRLVLDQINNHEYQSALKSIEQIFGKEKNKANIRPEESQWLRLLQGVCLSKLTFYGEATQIFADFASQKCLVDVQEQEILQILESIAQPLGLVGKVREIVEQSMNEKNLGKDQKALQNLLRVCVKEGNFDIAQKTASKLFTATKEIKYLIANVVFSFYAVNQLDVATQSDKITQQISLIKLYLTKIYTGLQAEKQVSDSKELNAAKQLVRFHYALLAKERKHSEMLELLLVKHPAAFSDYLNHLDRLEELFAHDATLFRTLVNANFAAFRTNSQMETFQMVYEKYDRFATLLFTQLEAANLRPELLDISKESLHGKLFEELADEECNRSIRVEHVEQYYASLEAHKNLLKSTQAKHPHFRNALKCVIQAQFGVISRMNAIRLRITTTSTIRNEFLIESAKKLVDDYIEYFACIFTFPEEILVSLKHSPVELHTYTIEKLEAHKETAAINRCIALINAYKTRIVFKQPVKQIESTRDIYAIWTELMNHYVVFFKEIYPEAETKAVEKGERLYVDDFIIIAADIAMEQVYRSPNEQSAETFKLLAQIVYLLECGLKKSQYNYDIQMRLLLISILIGNRERVYDLLVIMDVKGVQYETLGFLYLSTALDLGFDSNSDTCISRSLQFFTENLRESKEVMNTAIKNSNFEIWEFKSFDDWIAKSYLKMMASFAKSQQILKDQLKTGSTSTVLDANVKFFHKFCLQRLEEAATKRSGLVWNFDMRVIQSIFCHEESADSAKFYWNYLGLYNDSTFLKLNIHGTQLLFGLKDALVREFADEKESSECVAALKNLIEETKRDSTSLSVARTTDLRDYEFYNKPAYLQTYVTADDLQTNEISNRIQFEQSAYPIAADIAACLLAFVELTPKATTEEILNALGERIEEIGLKVQGFMKQLVENFMNDHSKSVFSLRFFKNLSRFSTGLARFIEVLVNSQDGLKTRLQKLQKKNGDLKKGVANLTKKFKADADAMLAILVESTQAIIAKLDSSNANAKDTVNAVIRNAVVEKVIETEGETGTLKSVLDLTNDFPNLKKDDILVRFSDEIAINYRYLGIVAVEQLKDILKIAKTAAK